MTPNYAGFSRRFIALVIDWLILIIPGLIVGSVLPYVGSIIVVLLYKPVFESSPLQGTPGKAMMGMMVLPENGTGRITFKQALIRYVSSILSALIVCIGYLMSLFTAKKQTLHDMIAETVVVYQEPPQVNYFQTWLTEVKAIFDGIPSGTSGSASNTMSSTTSASSASAASGIDQQAHAIETLHRLFQGGAISQEEYEAKKQQLLNKMS